MKSKFRESEETGGKFRFKFKKGNERRKEEYQD
jgi:hypothetical protein